MKYIIVIFIFFIFSTTANAQIIINEIMYDIEGADTGREWVEIKNEGSESINVLEWKFFEDGINHKLILVSGDGNMLGGSYAVISDDSDKFLSDNHKYTGTLFDSSFSLKNTGELISVRNAELNDIDTVTYNTELGAGGDGMSLQLVSGNWDPSFPTPGFANSKTINNETSSLLGKTVNSNPQNSNNSNLKSPVDLFSTEPQIFANAGNDKSVIVGADSLFEGKSFGLEKKPIENARYLWNFGNGETKEGQNVLHYYKYPGEYIVILNVSSGEYSASDRIVVNAFPAELSISKIEDDFIEIHNKSDFELSLSWWQLQSGNERFIIPKDTIILPNKKLIFSIDVTGLHTPVKEVVSLLYPNGVSAVTFEQIRIPQNVVATKTVAGEGLSSRNEVERGETFLRSVTNLKEEKQVTEKQIEESQENTAQTASANSSVVGSDKGGKIYIWILALISIVGISAGAVVFARKSNGMDEIEIIE